MKTEADTAVLKQSLLDSAVKTRKRHFSWPLSRQSVFSEAPSQTPSAVSSALQAVASVAVNQMENDIKKMTIKDPVDTSSERRTAEPRRTNQDPALYRGLLNQGATCYLNAALQVLFMTPAFRDRVLRAAGDTNEKLDSALKELFEELSKQDRDAPSVSTKGVIQALGIERVYEQQDAVEYFLDILEKVGLSLAEVFRGTIRNLRVCSENHESHDDSDFKSIQITLNGSDGPYTLEDGVRSYFASTILVGDDQMYCEDCDAKSDAIWSCGVQEYPAVLALHLKRFVYDYCSGRFVKNHCPLDVPLRLALGEHEYGLYAVINHRGSRFGGHYTADIRSPADSQWYCFDDSRVTQTDESRLKGSSEAYLLLYQKMDSPPGSETRKDTQDCHADPTDARTPSSVDRVEDVREEAEVKKSEAVDRGGGERCDRARNTPRLEASAVTGRLRILVLGRPETDKHSLAQMIVSQAGFSAKAQLKHGKTIKDSLEMCRPGPHVVLWVAPLENNKKDIEAFEEVYKFLGRRASKYIMIVFTSESRPTESIKNTTQKYRAIKNNHVLDISADLCVQVKELVSKLRKTVDRNEKRNKPYYDKKTQKIKRKKTKNIKHKRERSRK